MTEDVLLNNQQGLVLPQTAIGSALTERGCGFQTLADRMRKTIYSAALIILFIFSYGLYLYADALSSLPRYQLKLWNYYSLAFIIFGIWIIEAKKVDTFLQESILNGGKLIVLLCFLNVILTQHRIIKDPYTNLRIFVSGSALAISVLLYELINKHSKKWAIVTIASLAISLFLLLVFVGHITSALPFAH